MNTDILQDDESFLMVNVRGRSSGLPMNIWIGPRGGAKHAPRIKVQMDHREQFDTTALAVVSIEDNPPQVKEGRLSAADIESVRRYLAPKTVRPSLIIGMKRRTALNSASV
jgi:hypothetical protein